MSGLAAASELKIQSAEEQYATKPTVFHTENASLVN